MTLTIHDHGLASRLVDLGRPRSRHLGVPVGGAADRRSLALGNALVGNAVDALALEIALKGPRLRADCDLGCVVFGAPVEAWLEGVPMLPNRTFTLRAGQELRIGGTRIGARAYLCVRGGFESPRILGSRSGLDCVQRGETLACRTSTLLTRWCDEIEPIFHDETTIRVLPGLQADWFHVGEFYGQIFQITPASNRMGLRLGSRPLTIPNREMVSEPVCPGSVQVTREGQCIVLGVDGQTIGGYPKIAQVIDADLDALGQLRPGQRVQFALVTMAEAIAHNHSYRSETAAWGRRLMLALDAWPSERSSI
ncbi:MAG: biotin-dependent carboxyltransferase [Gemmataceae bacterium]|nr:biotin-dependent carboxyltransferase [Gemmataceae bacterium]